MSHPVLGGSRWRWRHPWPPGDDGFCHPAAVLIQVPLIMAWFSRQHSVCCHVSLFCDRVITTWLVRCLGPSRSVRKGAVGPAPRNLGADREGGKKSAWCPGPSGPYDKGKGDWYMASLVTDNCHLPYQTALIMLTILPEVRSRGYQLRICVEEAFASKCVGCLPPIFPHGFIPSHTYLLLSFKFLLLHRVMVTSTD